jgi:hypothetical protein
MILTARQSGRGTIRRLIRHVTGERFAMNAKPSGEISVRTIRVDDKKIAKILDALDAGKES